MGGLPSEVPSSGDYLPLYNPEAPARSRFRGPLQRAEPIRSRAGHPRFDDPLG